MAARQQQKQQQQEQNNIFEYNSLANEYMASSYRPVGSRGGPNHPPPQNVVVPVGISACVGHDNWASDVIHSVVSNKGSSSAGGSGSNSPDSSHSPVSSGYELSEKCLNEQQHSVYVNHKVRDKKRKFHSGRPLELKNLPDGCNEQAGHSFYFITTLEHPINMQNHKNP